MYGVVVNPFSTTVHQSTRPPVERWEITYYSCYSREWDCLFGGMEKFDVDLVACLLFLRHAKTVGDECDRRGQRRLSIMGPWVMDEG